MGIRNRLKAAKLERDIDQSLLPSRANYSATVEEREFMDEFMALLSDDERGAMNSEAMRRPMTAAELRGVIASLESKTYPEKFKALYEQFLTTMRGRLAARELRDKP